MQETIADAVLEGLQRVNVVSDRDRELFAEHYGYPVEEYAEETGDYDEEHYVGRIGGIDLEVTAQYEPEEVPLGYDSGGTNDDLASVIVQALLANGDVPQEQGRKVFAAVKEALDSYPKTFVNGREQNYFVGGPDELAEDLAPKIEEAMAKRGILGGIKKLLKLR